VNPFLFLCACGFEKEDFEQLLQEECKDWPTQVQREDACRAVLRRCYGREVSEMPGPVNNLLSRMEYLTQARIGDRGRQRFNEYLGLNISSPHLTYLDFMGAIALLYKVAEPILKWRPRREQASEGAADTFGGDLEDEDADEDVEESPAGEDEAADMEESDPEDVEGEAAAGRKDLLLEVARALPRNDMDSLENKRVRMPGEVMEQLVREWVATRIQVETIDLNSEDKMRSAKRSQENNVARVRYFPITVNVLDAANSTVGSNNFLDAKARRGNEPDELQRYIERMLSADNNWQLCDDTNPLSEVVQGMRITQVSDLGLEAVKRIEKIRLIHPSQHGRICPVETGEGKAAGIVMTKALQSRITADGEILAPLHQVVDGHRQWQEPWHYAYAKDQLSSRVVQFDTAYDADGKLVLPQRSTTDPLAAESFDSVPVVHLGMYSQSNPGTAQKAACAPPISAAVGLIPFVEHDDANRSLMGAKMQQQAVPCLRPERAIVGTGMEAHIASNSSWLLRSHFAGQVVSADASGAIVVQADITAGNESPMTLDDATVGEEGSKYPEGFMRVPLKIDVEASPQPFIDIAANKKRTMKHHTAVVGAGDVVSAGEAVAEGTCISGGEVALGKNLVCAYMPYEGYNYEDAITLSARMVDENVLTSVHIEEVTAPPAWTDIIVDGLGSMRSRVSVGASVRAGDVLATIRYRRGTSDARLQLEVPEDIVEGRVVDILMFDTSKLKRKKDMTLKSLVIIKIAVFCPVTVGDKLAGRHGNKGIVSSIRPEHEMPYLPDGTPVDIVLNPLGVPSRMNVGQILECMLGLAGSYSGQEFRVAPFDEMFGTEASRGVVFSALGAANDVLKEAGGFDFLVDPRHPGKLRVFDGRDGKPFDQPVTVGVAYIMKLYHMVRDKIHCRSTPMTNSGYDQKTGQPVKGRRRGGGQRVGEMEVQAFVSHHAPASLQEMVTVKSDDIQGRKDADLQLTCGENVDLPQGVTSQGTKTFISDIQAAGFGIVTGSRKRGMPRSKS